MYSVISIENLYNHLGELVRSKDYIDDALKITYCKNNKRHNIVKYIYCIISRGIHNKYNFNSLTQYGRIIAQIHNSLSKDFDSSVMLLNAFIEKIILIHYKDYDLKPTMSLIFITSFIRNNYINIHSIKLIDELYAYITQYPEIKEDVISSYNDYIRTLNIVHENKDKIIKQLSTCTKTHYKNRIEYEKTIITDDMIREKLNLPEVVGYELVLWNITKTIENISAKDIKKCINIDMLYRALITGIYTGKDERIIRFFNSQLKSISSENVNKDNMLYCLMN